MTPERLLTIDEVAAYLSIPKGTLYTWRSRGQGPPAIKVGALLRWRLSDVDAWVQDHLEAPPKDHPGR